MAMQGFSLARAGALILAISVVHAAPTAAASQATTAPAVTQSADDPLRRETPRGSFVGFVEASQRGNYALAADYLQWPHQKLPINKTDAASQLRFVLNHGFEGNLDRLSRDPGGFIDDGFPADRERVGAVVLADGGRVDIMLTRVSQETGPAIWLISADTVSEIPGMFGRAGLPRIERQLPSFLTETRLGRLQLWVPLALILLLPALFLVSSVLLRAAVGLTWLVFKLRGRPFQVRHSRAWKALACPSAVLIALFLHAFLSPQVGMPLLHRQYYSRTITILVLLGLVWWLWRFVDVLGARARDRMVASRPHASESVYTLGRRLLKGTAVGVAILAGLAAFGVNLTATLAGLGIGGVALAFAAQKTLENLFGGISVLSDRSIAVGDVCQIGKYVGEVEDVGLRSMQLRTPGRTVVSVPNGVLATMEVENFSRRDKFLFNPTVGLRYETTLEQLERVLGGIREGLAADDRIEPSTLRARLVRFGSYSLDVEVYAYVKASDYAAFLAVQEALLMRIMRIAQDAGTGLAIPSQATYVRPGQQGDRPARAPEDGRAIDEGTAGATQPSGSAEGEA